MQARQPLDGETKLRHPVTQICPQAEKDPHRRGLDPTGCPPLVAVAWVRADGRRHVGDNGPRSRPGTPDSAGFSSPEIDDTPKV